MAVLLKALYKVLAMRMRQTHRFWTLATTPPCPLGRLTQAARVTQSPGIAWPGWRELGSFAVVYVLKGRGHYSDAADNQHALTAGSLLLLVPELGHRYGAVGGGWSTLYIVFDGPAFDGWNHPALLDAHRRPVRQLPDVAHWRSRLEWVLGDDAPPLQQVVKLQTVLAEVVYATADTPAPSRSAPPDWFARACAWLAAPQASRPSLQQIAASLDMGYSTFRRSFAEQAGTSPAAYRTARLIEQAQRLMAHTARSDKQIALELGFVDSAHFSRRFRQVVGKTPTQFRLALA